MVLRGEWEKACLDRENITKSSTTARAKAGPKQNRSWPSPGKYGESDMCIYFRFLPKPYRNNSFLKIKYKYTGMGKSQRTDKSNKILEAGNQMDKWQIAQESKKKLHSKPAVGEVETNLIYTAKPSS